MIVGKLIVKTGTACTLRCEKCGEFNPHLAEQGRTFSNSAQILSEYTDKILYAVEKIDVIQVAGGEALLHSDLSEYLKFIYDSEKVGEIEVVTNGTVVPNEKMLRGLHYMRDRVKVIISDYSSSGIDMSKVTKVFDDNGVRYNININQVWEDRSGAVFHKLSENEMLVISDKCVSYRKNPYFTLINGKLSAHCPTAGSILHYYNLYEKYINDFIDINCVDKDNMEKALVKLNDKKTMDSCQYCIPSWSVKKCQAGKQIEEDLNA